LDSILNAEDQGSIPIRDLKGELIVFTAILIATMLGYGAILALAYRVFRCLWSEFHH